MISTGSRHLKVIGLMSGTSMDGVDAAYLETDGVTVRATGPALTVPYTDTFRQRLRRFIVDAPEPGRHPDEAELENALVDLHAAAVRAVRAELGSEASLDLVGFHGHTIWHRPKQRVTWQMGNGAKLAKAVDAPVAYDFRSADVAAGGEGAPLMPVYHAAMASALRHPVAVVNIGGVANITWIAEPFFEAPKTDGLLAFDTGPGNGQIDDWVQLKLGFAMDRGGDVAAKGKADETILAALMAHPYFAQRPPKSLDRLDFSIEPVKHLSAEDGAATLTAFTAASIARGLDFCPQRPSQLLVTGGGRHNAALMGEIARRAKVSVSPVEDVGWQGDALEAQGFGFMAVRCLRGLPITFPGTTGAAAPLVGGKIAQP